MTSYNNLYERIISFGNLYRAYRKVKRGKKNNRKFAEFNYGLEKNLLTIKEELLTFSYIPHPMKRRRIDDKSKKKEIYIPHIRDRIVHQALKRVLYPIFNKLFIHDSYAFRIGKGVHSCLRRFDSFKRKVTEKGHILKMDIKEYYPNINHQILVDIIKERIKDKRVTWLIKKILQASPNKKRLFNTYKGIPIGSPLSQLFANIYLNKLDYFVKHTLKEPHYLRFGDDCTILSKLSLRKTEEEIKTYANKSLILNLHPQKTHHTTPQNGVNLLGYKIFYYHKRIKNKNIERFKDKLKTLEEEYRLNHITPDKLTQKIRGWVEYARYANSYNLRKALFSKAVFVKSATLNPRHLS